MRADIRTFGFALIRCLLLVSSLASISKAGEDWLPVTQEELRMTGEPKAPGAAAVYLYRQVDRDDNHFHERVYARIKIFTDAGREYANVEIPFLKGYGKIKDIQGRTIHPDGSVVNFDGNVFEKTIVKAKGLKFLARTFTMPDVQPGSIVEYRYTRVLPDDYVYDSKWLLSEELFTKHAKFSLVPYSRLSLRMSTPGGLPQGAKLPWQDHNVVRMEIEDIPAFEIEDYMPPPDEMKYRVEFQYSSGAHDDVDKYWDGVAKEIYGQVNKFTDKRKAMEQAVAEIVSPADTGEQKLRKIYSRCQSLRNLSYERRKTEQEHSRENLKDSENVEDVWKRGYGDRMEITWLFLALARAAGFDATPVRVSTRDEHIFNRKMMNAGDLNANVVLVKLDGKDLYLSPGVAFAPFGLLPWYESGVSGLVIGKDGGAWVTTSLADAAASGVERKATLKLDDAGSVGGKVIVTFKGLSALWLRIDEMEEDDVKRKQLLEEEVKGFIPAPADVKLINSPDWSRSSDNLVAEFKVEIPSWTAAAGHRTLFPVGLFSGTEKKVFEHPFRVHPVYYHYPYQDQDDVTVELSQAWQVGGLPKAQDIEGKVCAYHADIQSTDKTLHVARQLTINGILFDTKYYPWLRNFYEQVRVGDGQQVVLSGGASSEQN